MFVVTLSAQEAERPSEQELRDSIDMIDGLIATHPQAYKLHLRKAALLIELDQWKEALGEYDKALEIVPGNTTALYYRAYVHNHRMSYKEARVDYEAVLFAEPQNSNALIGLIETNLADKHYTEAFDEANRLVEMHPTLPAAYATRSEVEHSQGMLLAAIDDIEKAIELEKPEAEKHYPYRMDDDIAVYELSAFALYYEQATGKQAKFDGSVNLGKNITFSNAQKPNKVFDDAALRNARESLDYLIKNGIPRPFLQHCYNQIKIR